MQARGPLMIEHRLIERMILIIQNALAQIESARKVDPLFVDTAIDFIRTYADRTHHGKEEDILFRNLSSRSLSAEDQGVMKELLEDHVFGRQTTKALVEANTRYRNGDESALADIVIKLQTLVEFYPKHIEKEDKIFFPASRSYFTDEEDQSMLAEFWAFDRKMIHEKYKSVVEVTESKATEGRVKMKQNDRKYLNNMLEMSREAMELVQNKAREDLDRDKQLTLSLLKYLEMIGSAASRISRECQNGCKPIPWGQVTEMKQQVVHTYWDIDLDWIWEKMEKDLPALSKAMEILLS